MISLLDVNLLVALFDEAHVHHSRAHEWLKKNRSKGWATCPITQNGCLRILSQPGYPGAIPVADITRRLRQATKAGDHHFWMDEVSLCDPALFDPVRVLSPKHLTDLYLLALATRKGGRLVTFDQGIPAEAVKKATSTNLVVL